MLLVNCWIFFVYIVQDAGYITEVHHVNGEGEDAGVVYCEMQARENSGESRCHLAMLRKMYPGHCGYKVNDPFCGKGPW